MRYRRQEVELQRSASSGQQLTGASTPAQSRQQINPALRSVPSCAKPDRQWVPELQQWQQQQLDVGFPVAAAVTAEPLSGHDGLAHASHLGAGPKQQSCHQLNARPASTDAFEPSVSACPPLQGSSTAGAGLHAGDLGDDMCDPVELTWEGVLQAANGQEPRDPGDAAWLLTNEGCTTGIGNDNVKYQR